MTAAPRQEIQRVYLAPHRSGFDWTLGDFEQFVADCKRSGIPATTRLVGGHSDPYMFGTTPDLFYVERTEPLESTQGI